jgi:hypothetical protein
MRGWFRVAAGPQQPTAQPSRSPASPPTFVATNRPGDLPYQRFLQSPYREILRNRRFRHTPGTRQTRCLRAGKRSGLWDVCRRLPSFSGLRLPQTSKLDATLPAHCRHPHRAMAGRVNFHPGGKNPPLRLLAGAQFSKVPAFGYANLVAINALSARL